MSYDKLSVEEIDKEINNIIKPKFFLEFKVDRLSHDDLGQTLLNLRIVLINKNLSKEDYAHVKVHEYIHLVEFTNNERYVEFRTIQLMWNSNNNYIKRSGIKLALLVLDGKVSDKYDCSNEIIQYFKTII